MRWIRLCVRKDMSPCNLQNTLDHYPGGSKFSKGGGLNDTTTNFSPEHLNIAPTQDINLAVPEHFCTPVVHPKTGEIVITKYQRLANDTDPEVKETWRNAIGKDFGNIVQGNARTGTPGTNAIFVLTHDQIKAIPKSKTVTHARLVKNPTFERNGHHKQCEWG